MEQHIREIDYIAKNPQPPTFENTIVALDNSGAILDRVSAVFFGLEGAEKTDTIEQIANEITPKLAAHNDDIFLNQQLFNRIKTL
jgi:peptidyl-dipeptidase Dcp